MKKIKLETLSIQSFITKVADGQKLTLKGGDSGSLSCGGPDCPRTTNVNNPDCPEYQTGRSYVPKDCPQYSYNGGEVVAVIA